MVETQSGFLSLNRKGLQGFFLTLWCSWHVGWLTDTNSAPEKMCQHRRSPRAPRGPKKRFHGAAQWIRAQGTPNLLWESQASRKDALPDWIPLASTPSLPLLPQERSCEGETREFWKRTVNPCSCALLCKCYTNWSLKSGPNDAMLLCLRFPDTHSEMHCTDVSLLCTPITHSPSRWGGLLAATPAAQIVTECAPVKDVV